MKRSGSLIKWMVALSCVAVMFLVGCESDSDSTPVAVAGTWTIVDSDGDISSLVLNQANNTLTGTLTSGGITLGISTGSKIEGDKMTIVITINEYTLTLKCTATTTTLNNGTFSDTTGDSGTFSGTKQ